MDKINNDNKYLTTFLNYSTDGADYFDENDNDIGRNVNFDKDWNLLMKVIDKIDKIKYIEITILGEKTIIINRNVLDDPDKQSVFMEMYKGRLTNTFQAVVYFLKHNDNYLKLR